MRGVLVGAALLRVLQLASAQSSSLPAIITDEVAPPGAATAPEDTAATDTTTSKGAVFSAVGIELDSATPTDDISEALATTTLGSDAVSDTTLATPTDDNDLGALATDTATDSLGSDTVAAAEATPTDDLFEDAVTATAPSGGILSAAGVITPTDDDLEPTTTGTLDSDSLAIAGVDTSTVDVSGSSGTTRIPTIGTLAVIDTASPTDDTTATPTDDAFGLTKTDTVGSDTLLVADATVSTGNAFAAAGAETTISATLPADTETDPGVAGLAVSPSPTDAGALDLPPISLPTASRISTLGVLLSVPSDEPAPSDDDLGALAASTAPAASISSVPESSPAFVGAQDTTNLETPPASDPSALETPPDTGSTPLETPPDTDPSLSEAPPTLSPGEVDTGSAQPVDDSSAGPVGAESQVDDASAGPVGAEAVDDPSAGSFGAESAESGEPDPDQSFGAKFSPEEGSSLSSDVDSGNTGGDFDAAGITDSNSPQAGRPANYQDEDDRYDSFGSPPYPYQSDQSPWGPKGPTDSFGPPPNWNNNDDSDSDSEWDRYKPKRKKHKKPKKGKHDDDDDCPWYCKPPKDGSDKPHPHAADVDGDDQDADDAGPISRIRRRYNARDIDIPNAYDEINRATEDAVAKSGFSKGFTWPQKSTQVSADDNSGDTDVSAENNSDDAPGDDSGDTQVSAENDSGDVAEDDSGDTEALANDDGDDDDDDDAPQWLKDLHGGDKKKHKKDKKHKKHRKHKHKKCPKKCFKPKPKPVWEVNNFEASSTATESSTATVDAFDFGTTSTSTDSAVGENAFTDFAFTPTTLQTTTSSSSDSSPSPSSDDFSAASAPPPDASSPDASSPDDFSISAAASGSCPATCNPTSGLNKCAVGTTCVTAGKRNYCACQAGFRIKGVDPKDTTKQFHVSTTNPYVYVQPGLQCEQVCDNVGWQPYACAEVTVKPDCA